MDENQITSKLDTFFCGLDSGLNSLREVRSAYDREIAFDFNPLSIFNINENKVSEILAYFLDPEAKHGQKNTFLRTFLKMLNLGTDTAIQLLNQGKAVKVSPQDFTRKNRPIDVVVTFGDNEFVIGIENKVWGAEDQENQIKDYIEEIARRSGPPGMAKSSFDEITKAIQKDPKGWNFLMLYLSRDGSGPSELSIAQNSLKTYVDDKLFVIIPFNKSIEPAIIPMLKAFADEAKADNVRAFLKLMIKYFSNEFLGVKAMDENEFAIKYLKKHPEFFAEIPLVQRAHQAIVDEVHRAFHRLLRNQLAKSPRKIQIGSQDWPNTKSSKISYEMKMTPTYIQPEFEGYDVGVPLRKEKLTEEQARNLDAYLGQMKKLYPKLKTTEWWAAGWITLPVDTLGCDLAREVIVENAESAEKSGVIESRAKDWADYIVNFVDAVELSWPRDK